MGLGTLSADTDGSWNLVRVGVAVVLMTSVVTAIAVPDRATASVQAGSFSVDDASIEAESVERINLIANQGTAEWTALPTEVQGAVVWVFVEGPDGEMQQAASERCTAVEEHGDCVYNGTPTSGEVTYGISYSPSVDVLADTDWSAMDFEAAPGETRKRTLDVMLEVEVTYDGGSVTTSATDPTTITVTNPADTGDADVAIMSGGFSVT